MDVYEAGQLRAGEHENQSDQESAPATVSAADGPRWKTWLQRLTIVRPLWALYRGYSRRSGPLLSAGIAYYLLFSLVPVTFLTLRITGHFMDPATAEEHLEQTFETYVGPGLASLFTSIAMSDSSRWGTVALMIACGVLLYGATRLVLRLQAAFNLMWDIRVMPSGFSYRRLLSRLLLFSLLLIPSAILLISVGLESGIPALQGLAGGGVLIDISQGILAFLVSWGVLILVFAILPDIRVSMKDCWQGALLTAVLLAVGTRAFRAYILWADSPKYASTLGAVLALVVWADFMAMIILLGVRLNKVLYQLSGKTVQPYDYAVVLDDPVLATINDVNPEDWERLYTGASGVVRRGAARTAGKTASPPPVPVSPPSDGGGPDDS